MNNFKFRHFGVLVAGTVAMLTIKPARATEAYFYHGNSAVRASFFLIGGQYSLYVYAKRPVIGSYAPEAKSCIFGGNFQRVWPTQDAMSLGAGVTISTIVPHKIGPEPVTLPAGLYSLFIPPLTTCDWKFVLNSTNENPAGIAPVTMFKAPFGVVFSDTASLRDLVQFDAQFRTEHDQAVPVSGNMQILHDGQVVRTMPLTNGHDTESGANTFFANVKWGPDDVKWLGKNAVKFTVKIGSAEFTSSGEFTLTQ